MPKIQLSDREYLSLVESRAKTTVNMPVENYAFLFASLDNDLGRTNVVKHKIDTGESLPIKQIPRRLPVHMSEEAGRLISRRYMYATAKRHRTLIESLGIASR